MNFRQLENDRIVKSHDPADEWEQREAKKYFEEDPDQYICQCGAEKAWDCDLCDECFEEQKKRLKKWGSK